MKPIVSLLCAIVLAGCASTYAPPSSGPVVNLTVQPDVKAGIPLMSSASLTLWLYELQDETYPGTDIHTRTRLGWIDIATDEPSAPIALNADQPVVLELSYSSHQMFGPNLSGSKSLILYPEPGADYVMRFWTDKKRFSTQIFRKSSDGELTAARVVQDNYYY